MLSASNPYTTNNYITKGPGFLDPRWGDGGTPVTYPGSGASFVLPIYPPYTSVTVVICGGSWAQFNTDGACLPLRRRQGTHDNLLVPLLACVCKGRSACSRCTACFGANAAAVLPSCRCLLMEALSKACVFPVLPPAARRLACIAAASPPDAFTHLARIVQNCSAFRWCQLCMPCCHCNAPCDAHRPGRMMHPAAGYQLTSSHISLALQHAHGMAQPMWTRTVRSSRPRMPTQCPRARAA